MTLMALMLEITTSTGTTTMELSAVTMGDENRVSPPFDGLDGFVVDRFCERIHNSQCTTFQAKLAGCCCFK